mmetsp:Transcript_1541/g.3508  ORF Transcript_1541/g.3508 Transcript_1541/m.3508 type:complete len:276 (+) Transcript_1541:1870-2697(+)
MELVEALLDDAHDRTRELHLEVVVLAVGAQLAHQLLLSSLGRLRRDCLAALGVAEGRRVLRRDLRDDVLDLRHELGLARVGRLVLLHLPASREDLADSGELGGGRRRFLDDGALGRNGDHQVGLVQQIRVRALPVVQLLLLLRLSLWRRRCLDLLLCRGAELGVRADGAPERHLCRVLVQDLFQVDFREAVVFLGVDVVAAVLEDPLDVNRKERLSLDRLFQSSDRVWVYKRRVRVVPLDTLQLLFQLDVHLSERVLQLHKRPDLLLRLLCIPRH